MKDTIELTDAVTPAKLTQVIMFLKTLIKLVVAYLIIESCLIAWDWSNHKWIEFKRTQLELMLKDEVDALNLQLDPKTGLPKEKLQLAQAEKAAVMYKFRADVCAGHTQEIANILGEEMDGESGSKPN